MCSLYTYTNICIPRFGPSGFFGPSRCLVPTPGLTSEYSICAVCVCACAYTRIHPHTLPPALKIEKTQTTPLSFFLSKNNPPRQATSAFIDWLNPCILNVRRNFSCTTRQANQRSSDEWNFFSERRRGFLNKCLVNFPFERFFSHDKN